MAEPMMQRNNLRDQALSILRERLVSGALLPGAIYSASALAAELGVSTSPVREAMLTLVNQGLMEVVRNRGFRVTELSETERRNISQLRFLLEVPVMASLAGDSRVRDNESVLSGIASEIVDAAQQGDIPRYLEADRRFHLTILAFAENERLSLIVEELRDRTRLFNLTALSDRGDLLVSAEEHHQILAAMVNGDVGATDFLMKRHLEHIDADWAAPSPVRV